MIWPILRNSRKQEPGTVGSDRAHKVLDTGQEDGQVGNAEEQGPDRDETAKLRIRER